jgi:hypothetical protein
MSQRVMGRAFLLTASVGFLAIPAIATAHAGNNDPNAVHACINNTSLSIRVVGLLGSCISAPASKAETAAHWAIQGPPGPMAQTARTGLTEPV